MSHQEKLEALMAAVDDNIVFPPAERGAVQQALLEGFIRILYAEEAEARARQPYAYFPVELSMDQGFALWNRGGFDGVRGRGEALLCVGLDGRRTRVIRTIRERNGRHELALVYQGCYLLQAQVAHMIASPDIVMYQVIGFCSKDGSYQARCQKVYSSLWTQQKLTAEQLERYGQAIELCGGVACTPNLYQVEWP